MLYSIKSLAKHELFNLLNEIKFGNSLLSILRDGIFNSQAKFLSATLHSVKIYDKTIGGFMTVDQALEKLKEAGVTDSIQTVRRWLREGKIKAHRSEYRKAGFLVDAEDLNRFINERTGRDKVAEINTLKTKLNHYTTKYSQLQNDYERLDNEHTELLKKQLNKKKMLVSEDRYTNEFINVFYNLIDSIKKKIMNDRISIDLAFLIANHFEIDEQQEVDLSIWWINEQKHFKKHIAFFSNFVKVGAKLTHVERYMGMIRKYDLTHFLKVDTVDWDKFHTILINWATEDRDVHEALDIIEKQFKEDKEKSEKQYDEWYKNASSGISSFSPEINYREKLGLSSTATNEDIKREYKKLIKILHPDKGGNAKMFQNIKEEFDEFRSSI